METSPTHSHHGPTNSPSNFSSVSTTSENEEPTSHTFAKCKRKIEFPPFSPTKHQPPATVARRNARERNRVKQVNNGFASLKQHIPPEHRAKKMSKVETLRCAVDYIRRLQVALDISRMTGDGSKCQKSVLDSMGDMDFDGSYAGSTNEHLSHSPSSSDDPGDQRPFGQGPLGQGLGAQSSGLYEYDTYDAVTSGDEDELLDAISNWQQS